MGLALHVPDVVLVERDQVDIPVTLDGVRHAARTVGDYVVARESVVVRSEVVLVRPVGALHGVALARLDGVLGADGAVGVVVSHGERDGAARVADGDRLRARRHRHGLAGRERRAHRAGRGAGAGRQAEAERHRDDRDERHDGGRAELLSHFLEPPLVLWPHRWGGGVPGNRRHNQPTKICRLMVPSVGCETLGMSMNFCDMKKDHVGGLCPKFQQN